MTAPKQHTHPATEPCTVTCPAWAGVALPAGQRYGFGFPDVVVRGTGPWDGGWPGRRRLDSTPEV